MFFGCSKKLNYYFKSTPKEEQFSLLNGILELRSNLDLHLGRVLTQEQINVLGCLETVFQTKQWVMRPHIKQVSL